MRYALIHMIFLSLAGGFLFGLICMVAWVVVSQHFKDAKHMITEYSIPVFLVTAVVFSSIIFIIL